jgi:hypothetical protein
MRIRASRGLRLADVLAIAGLGVFGFRSKTGDCFVC